MLRAKKKIFIRAFLVVYCLSFLLQEIFYLPWWWVSAEEPITNTNIIAIFVDSRFNDGNINRYASKYIQSKMYDTQALVFPINKDNFRSYDIYKVLQNLYLEWEKTWSSRLIWTILVWDIPLPVVKNWWYVFPSIYPYVDFKEPKYPYNKQSWYFETSEDNNWLPEIWHWIINFGDDKTKYENYFHKLKDFSEKTNEFTTSDFWYEDFINLNSYYNSDNLKYYINNFLFFEDIIYHRYTQLLFEIFDADYKNNLYEKSNNYASLINDLKKENDKKMENADYEFDSVSEISNEYFTKASNFANQYMTTTSSSVKSTQIPTLTLPTILEWYLKTYNNIFGQQYLNDMNNNLAASWRRTEWKFENHIQKIILKDELIKKLIKNYNDLLEDAVDQKIVKEKYNDEIPVPIKYEERDRKECNVSSSWWEAYLTDTKVWAINFWDQKLWVKLASNENIKISDKDDETSLPKCYEVLSWYFENFYFGKYAGDIDISDDFTIYKWKYKNFTWIDQLKWYSYDISKIEDIEIDAFNRSLWSTYAVNDREIMANRWMNYEKAKTDSTTYIATKCSDSETAELWSYRWRGWASPLNIDTVNFSNWLKLKGFLYNAARNPSTNKAIWGRVYDMAWTELKSEDNEYTQTYKWYLKYWAMIKLKKGHENSDQCSSTQSDLTYCGSIAKETISMDKVDYKTAKSKNGKETKDETGKYITIEVECDREDQEKNSSVVKNNESGSNREEDCCDGWKRKIYYYKLIDSRVKNSYPYSENISAMNIGTMERPVDSSRFITFKWLKKELVKFIYPDMFNVEVYKKQWDKLILKSIDEIKESIKNYLKLKLQQYNSYGANFDEKFFEDILEDENITRLANALYYLNIPLEKRNAASYEVLSDLQYIKDDFNINSKIKLVLEQYLKTTSSRDQLINPYYNEKAYEAGFINSNGFDILSSKELPAVVEKIQSAKNSSPSIKNLSNGNSTSTTESMMSLLDEIMNSIEEKKDEEECGEDEDGSVDLFQWPWALSCWMSQTFGSSWGSSSTTTISDSSSQDIWSNIVDRTAEDSENTSSDNASIAFSQITYETDTTFRLDYSTFSNKYDEKDRDDYITNRYTYINTDKKANEKTLTSLSDTEKTIYNDISQNIEIKTTPNSSINLDEYNENNNYYIDISSKKDLGSLNIDIAGIWDNCIFVEWKDICKQNYSIKLNPYVNETLLSIKLNDKISGNTLLQFKFCKEWSNVCYYTDYNLNIVSGKVKQIKVETPNDKLLKWWQIPFAVKAIDANGNEIWQLSQTYKVSVDYGNIRIKDTKIKEYEFNRFSDAYFVYDSSELWKDWEDLDITIKVEPIEEYKSIDSTLPQTTQKIKLVNGSAKIKSDWKEISNITYQLPDDFAVIYDVDEYKKAQLKEDAILKYSINLTTLNWAPLSALTTITTKNWYLIPGIVKEKTLKIKKDWEEIQTKQKYFAAKTEYVLEWWNLEFYMHPTMSAGDDELIVDIDGLWEIKIPIKVLPASAIWIVVDTPKTAINVWEQMEVVIRVSDIRWNTVDNKNNEVFVWVSGKASFDWETNKELMSQNGKIKIKLKGEDPGWDVYIYWYLTSKVIEDQIPDYEKIMIKNILWPTTNLNIVYLSLFGNDWWNMWWYFSSNNNFSQDLISNSDKLLAVTTQLVNLEQIKEFKYLIRSDLFINNIDNINSYVKLQDSKLKISFGNLTSPKWDITIWNIWDFDIQKSDSIPKNLNSNKIYYIAEPTDSKITSNLFENKKIIINWETIVNFGDSYISEDAKILLSDNTENWYNLWELSYKNKKAWTIVIYRADSDLVSNFANSFSRPNWDYQSMVVFWEWSTNWKQWIWIYDSDSSMSDTDQSFNSIEDSLNTDLNIWFREWFKSITAFGNWDSVWESTLPYSSEYLINFGDPIIKRISKNENKENLSYDGWVGKTIYSDANNNILKTVDIDFNNDGYKDLVIAYRNWGIKLLKNYGWNNPFVDMWDLIYVADWVQDIRWWDVDGDWFEDLYIRSWNNKLRVYKNKSWIFDPDGTLVCIDIYGWDENVKSAYQIFVQDMDLDKKADIITNDVNGYVKITYWDTYLSTNKYYCDEWYTSRLKQKLVYNFWLNVKSDKKVYDKSLIHRKWMRKPETWPEDYNDPMTFSWNLYNFTGDSQYTSMDMNMEKYATFVNLTAIDQAKYQSMPDDYIPSYEINYTKSDLYYARSLYALEEDKVISYKKYTDENWWNLEVWDKVNIDVYFEWNDNTKFTYLEDLSGPWVIAKNNDNSIASFDEWSLSTDATVDFDNSDWYDFKIENVSISDGETQKVSYSAYYRGAQLVNIDLDNINDDQYTDIKAYPEDACYKWYCQAVATDSAQDYDLSIESLKDEYEKKISDTWWNFDDYLQNTSESASSVISSANEDTLSSYNFTESWDEDEPLLNFDANMDIDDMTLELDGDIGWAMQWMKNLASKIQNALCNGIKFDYWSCWWIPVPFNMAFLAPWMYNIFGCGLMPDPWLPIFYYPSTLYIPFPIPVPNMLQAAWMEWFMAPPGGIFPSMIRLYLAPTLTQKLWIVACFGPYMAWMLAFPPPIWTISWNCVVTAVEVPLQCSKNKDSSNDYDYTIEWWQEDLLNIWTCNKDLYVEDKDTSPFSIYINWDVWSQQTEDAFDFGEISLNLDDFYLWDMEPSSVSNSLLKTSKSKLDVDDIINDFSEWWLKEWEWIQLKIEWADVRWLVKCIIKKWLDNQIRYIINNLTNMTIYLYYPDLTWLVDWFENLNWKTLSDKWDDLKKSVWEFKNSVSSMFSSNWWAGSSGGSTWSKVKDYAKKMTPSKSWLKKMSDSLSNPFEMIKDFFDEIPLVNVKSKSVNINVPFIYAEDIERYIQYLQARKDKNLWFLDSLDGESSCSQMFSDASQIQDCISNFANIKVNASKLKSSIERNIDRLYEYKDFPMKLYDYVHALDKYLDQITQWLENFIDNTVWWLVKNADRFEKWVDLIETLIAIIDTWQILIEFSVNWKVTCGKCRMDGYDFYSCILSLLCIELPVLPIPPFKIPDIYLDFSHIDIWVDITIPNIKFTPSSISLPKLPDLWDINVNVSLPSIPELPELPNLPDLPDLDFDFDLNLPTLPPAPKIPEIMPAIKAILDIAKRIWTILCIIKWNIWLVAERNAKSRVEQITQRTNRVFPFDFMNITMPKAPLEWKDIRMDTYLRLKFEFDQLTDFVDGVADDINSKTSEISESANLIPSYDSFWDTDIDIDIDRNNDNTVDVDVDNNIDLFNYNDAQTTSWYDVQTAKSELKSWLMYMIEQETNIEREKKEKDVVAYLNKPNKVLPNIDWVKDAVKWAQNYVQKKKIENNKLSQKIKDNYKDFLKDISNNKLVSNEDLWEIEFKSSLFNGDQELVERISNQENPSKTYLELNKTFIDWFKDSLNKNTAEYLKMDESTYNKTKSYMNTLSNKVDYTLGYLDKNELTSYQESQSQSIYQSTDIELPNELNLWNNFQDQMLQIASTDTISDSSSSWWSGSILTKYVDMTQYTQWFYAKWTDGYYRNVINRYEKWTTAYKNNKYKITDINWDSKEDILRWDNNNIYLKYSEQEDGFKNSDKKIYDDFYEFKTFDSPDKIKSSTDNDGYYKLKWKKYKIWSDIPWLDLFDNAWQTSENISFSWIKNSDAEVWYVIKLVQRIDVFYDKDKELKYYGNDMLDKKYLLIVPENFDESKTKISFDDISKKFAYDLAKDGEVEKIIKKNLSGDSVVMSLNDIISKWYYVEVAPLSKDPSNENLRKKSWPWSIQKTAWPQIWADDQSPLLSLKLVRSKTGKIVSEWNTLKWYINTNYDIDASWSDNWVVVESRIEQNDKIIKQVKWWNISLENKYFTSVQKDKYTFAAKDHAGNVQKEDIVLEIWVPEISIKDITLKKTTWSEIIADLTQDIDDGTVKFQRNRYGYWENLTWDTGDSNFEISADSEIITWWVFDISESIVLKDSDWKTIWLIQTQNGNIAISEDYQDQIDFRLDFSKKVPIIDIMKNGNALYEIYLQWKELAWTEPIKINNWDYELLQLTGNIEDEFKWWYCIKKKLWECVFYIWKTAQFYIPEPYNIQYTWKYSFDKTNSSILYNIYDNSDNSIFDINYIAEPLSK